MMTDLDAAKKMLEIRQKEYDSLIKQHGTGVRPSWVSTDLAILQDKIQGYKQDIASLMRRPDGL
jgi:hypothetical protein